PFLSVTKDPEVYEQFEKIILMHGVRHVSDLAYYDRFLKELPEHEYLGDMVKEKLIYYPVVSREDYTHKGRITDFLINGTLFEELGLPRISPENDRAMICGGPDMLKSCVEMLTNEFGLKISPKTGVRGDFVIERAFVDQ
ncbi:MAG: ferredoxin--NADP reductase, partial [Neisseriaceae bacterium]|nr:ferredoxin--NADP reductase [Neisseriaceae bacterium]